MPILKNQANAKCQIPSDVKNVLVQLGGEIAEHQRHCTWNQTVLNKLFSCLDQVETSISELKNSLKQFERLSIVNVPFCNQRLQQCETLLQELRIIGEIIGNSMNKLQNEVNPSSFVRELDDLQFRLQSLQQDLSIVEASLDNMEQIRISANVSSSSDIDDTFKAVDSLSIIPKNPSRMLLEYNKHNSLESQLKYAIFRTDKDCAVGAVSMGIGGVGKTCALNDIGYQSSTKERFPGGVLYMTLGKEATLQTLIEKIANFVEMTGGKSISKLIRQQNENLNEAARLAAEWFRTHICLFIIDDIWCLHGIQPSVTTTLRRLAAHPFSKVVYSTKDNNVELEEEEIVCFTKRDPLQSRKILLHCTRFKQEPNSIEAKQAFENILDRCDGLPIALGIVGSLVAAIQRNVPEHEETWIEAESELSNQSSYQRNDTAYSFKELILASIRAMDAENAKCVSKKSKDEFSPESETEKCFKAFSVLQYGQYIPVDVLGRLWGTAPKKTISQVDAFERFSLIDIVYYYRGNLRKSVKVHDLVLDFARDIGMDSSVDTCNRFIQSYKLNESDSIAQLVIETNRCIGNCSSTCDKLTRRIFGRKSNADQSSDITSLVQIWTSIDDDGFALANLFRFLKVADIQDKGLQLLEYPSWIKKQYEANGRVQLEQDIYSTLQFIYRSDSLQQGHKNAVIDFLNVLRASLVEGEFIFSNHSIPNMIYTQLYGRMMHFSEHNEIVQAFLYRIEETEEWWMKPSLGTMPVPNSSVRTVLHIGKVHQILYFGEIAKVIAEENNSIILYEYKHEDNELKQICNFQLKENEHGINVILSSEGNTLVCATNMRVLRSQVDFDSDCFFRKFIEIDTQGRKVDCVAVSGNGRCIVAGTHDGNISVFETDNGKWSRIDVEVENCGLVGISMSEDAHHMVSRHSHRYVYVWNLNNGTWKSVKLDTNQIYMSSVKMSMNARRIVLAFNDGTIQVWELQGTDWKKTEIKGCHDADKVVRFNSQGCRFFTYSRHRSIGIWDYNNDKWECTGIVRNDSRGEVLQISSDEQWIWSQLSGTVRLETFNQTKRSRILFDGHEHTVQRVQVSTDGKRMISASRKMVLVWEFTERRWKVILAQRFKNFTDVIWSVTISGTGLHFGIGSVKGVIETVEYKFGGWKVLQLQGEQEDRNWTEVVMNSDGRFLVSYSNRERIVKVWRKFNRYWRLILSTPSRQEIHSLLFFGSGSRFLVGFKNTVEDWIFKKGEWSHTKHEPNNDLNEIVLLRANGTLKIGSGDEKSSNRKAWKYRHKKWDKTNEDGTIRTFTTGRFDENEEDWFEEHRNDFGEVTLQSPLTEWESSTYLAYKSCIISHTEPPYLSFVVEEN